MSEHWLTRRVAVRWLWAAFVLVLALSVLAGLAVGHHGYFDLDGTFGFTAWYGLGACVAMVVLARALALVLERPEACYGDG